MQGGPSQADSKVQFPVSFQGLLHDPLEWAMAPLAVTLGLTAELRVARPGLPVRKPVTEVMVAKMQCKMV